MTKEGSIELDIQKNHEQEFQYDVDLHEEVLGPDGKMIPRYGRARDRAFRHLGDKAPLRLDGALFDRMFPGRDIMPTNVQVLKGNVHVSGTGKVTIMPDRLAFCHTPGGVYGD